jgi:PTH1 family peptidyl-tRNA hydrolase
MKYLIVGLGNPGVKYDNTRHNIGFEIVTALAKELDYSFNVDRHCEKSEAKYKGRTLILIKPSTYMNLSGKAVHYWLQKEKIPLDRLLVINDDLALPFGKLRLKGKGSDGGHNGLKDIQAVLNTTVYNRLRFGVGGDFPKGRQSDYVLGNWSEEEHKELSDRIKLGVEFVKSFSTIGLEMTMSALNGK